MKVNIHFVFIFIIAFGIFCLPTNYLVSADHQGDRSNID